MLAIEGVMLAPARAGKRRKGLACDLDEALAHLRKTDPKLGAVIDRAVAPAMRLDATESTFQALAQSIVYQQLSGKAAATIYGRLRDLFPRRKLTPERLRDAKDEALRGAGLSRGKTLALRDLATRTLAGTVPDVERLHTMSDDAIVDRLVQVRGIGRWTVQMLLIFRLGRPDVLPIDDYGVRAGFQKAYGKRKMPTPRELARHGERWKPFRTLGAWYMWRALELSRGEKSDGRG
jgi:3-methyladenine DNA glycosylase/8-oxoguanine DNA glycosylase